MPERYYLTTPIYYVNARAHVGHAYSTIVCDAIARRKRALGFDTWFLTGTDEHGQKIERSARAAGVSPKVFADQVSAQFRELWDRMELSYDDFIRTTDERHKRGVQRLFTVLQERGFIYKGAYTGQYCVFDELYVDALPGAPCPDCGRITETVSEENYFFKLSEFGDRLLQHYDDNPGFIRPEGTRNEVLSVVRSGLKDLSISRTSFDWGIPVPGDEKHVIYVWLDALANYITAIGYGSDDAKDEAKFQRYWPADLHLIGKEISRFHCIYWPAFLMAAGLPLPKCVAANGWLLFEESKMSKSRGNIVRAETVIEVLGADALRYFLLREIVFGQDGSFSFDALVQRYNSDLANGYGNLVSRTLAMISKYFGGVVPGGSVTGVGPGAPVVVAAEAAIAAFGKRFEALDFSRALEALWGFVATVDGYITARAPWKLGAKLGSEEDAASRAQLGEILYTCAESLRVITALVYPVLPGAAANIWRQLGLGDIHGADLTNVHWGWLPPGTRLGELSTVFPRAEKDAIQRMQDIEDQNNTPGTASSAGRPEGHVHTEAPHAHSSKLGSVLDGIAVAIAESTSESAALVAFEDAVLGVRKGAAASQSIGADQGDPSPAVGSSIAAATSAAPVGLTAPVAARAVDAPDAGAQPLVPPAGMDAAQAASTAPATVASAAAAAAAAPPQITIDDFAKVELRVAKIVVAERIPKADKLLRLEVDLGYERRQILAGIAEAYTPESLLGRKVVIVANLAPRKLRGLESNGMIVAASLGEHGKPVLAGFLEDIEIGARLK
ncbi:MAG TPA: methionine--tRNA ligase [Acidisarcina sp.]